MNISYLVMNRRQIMPKTSSWWTFIPGNDKCISRWDRLYTPRLRGIVWPPTQAVAYPCGGVEILRGKKWHYQKYFTGPEPEQVMHDIDAYVADLREAISE